MDGYFIQVYALIENKALMAMLAYKGWGRFSITMKMVHLQDISFFAMVPPALHASTACIYFSQNLT